MEDMIPLLVEVQSNLAGDLDLEALAQRFGYSPYHFHRVFKEAVGETPRQYVQRLRIEKAAYLLLITTDSVLDISLTTGFRNPETLARAFRKAFGTSPSTYRKEGRHIQRQRIEQNRDFRGNNCVLSDVRYESLRPMALLCIRNIGDYWDIPRSFSKEDRLWNRLVAWADERKVRTNRIPIGLYHDDPTVTRSESLRCDACIPIESKVAAGNGIRCYDFTGGPYGVIEHTGPATTIDQAFRRLADSVRSSGRYEFRDGPAVEIERDTEIGASGSIHHTYVYLPVSRL